jgi:CrcB protein
LFNKIISVAIFGAIGGILRYLLQTSIDPYFGTFPLSLILINVSGSMVLGMLTGGLLTLLDTSETLNVGLTTGLMGGFTTFSTFELTLFNLFKTNQWVFSMMLIVISLILSLSLANLGQWFGQRLLSHYRKGW